jgi:hypothetical protein
MAPVGGLSAKRNQRRGFAVHDRRFRLLQCKTDGAWAQRPCPLPSWTTSTRPCADARDASFAMAKEASSGHRPALSRFVQTSRLATLSRYASLPP